MTPLWTPDRDLHLALYDQRPPRPSLLATALSLLVMVTGFLAACALFVALLVGLVRHGWDLQDARCAEPVAAERTCAERTTP